MNTPIVLPRLGQEILVVIDRAPGFPGALRRVAAYLPYIARTYFTLLCCCPVHYWEHGGADNPEVRHDIDNAWIEDEQELDQSERCVDQAKSILHAAGVPDSHIQVKHSEPEEESLMGATIAELKQGSYSGLIICRYHEDIVNRLLRQGITDAFRRLPKVEVLAIDVE